jgi:predicted enzyme related to lactoylglutathione lyase
MSGRVVHFEIPYDDAERARRFYAEAFGWTLNAVPEMDYTLATTGPGDESGPTEPGFIDGGMAARGVPLAGPTVVIDVEDIDSALAKVESLGGSTLLARTPVGEMGFSAYFNDSEGNVVGLWQNA